MITRRAKAFYYKAHDIVHEYPRTFWVLMAGTFIDHIGGGLIFPFFAVYIAKHFNATMVQVGTVFAIFSIAGVFGNILSGAMIDRFGRRFMMLFGLVFSAVSSITMALINDLNMMYSLAVLIGLMGSIGGPAQQAMIADLLPEKKLADGYGMHRVVFNLAVAIGPVIGGLLAPQTGYLLLFVLDAVTSIIMAVIVFALLPETKPQPKAAKAGEPIVKPESFAQTLAGYRKVLADAPFVAFAAVSMIMTMAYLQMYGTLSVYLVKFQNQPESTYGFILGINALMVVVLQFPTTRRISNRPPMLVMVAGTLLYAVGFAMYGFVATMFFFILAMVIITIGEMLTAPVLQALVGKFAPEDMRGRYFAIFGFAWIIPNALAPLMAGWIMDNTNPAFIWYVAGVMAALAGLGYYGLHVREGRRLGERLDMPGEPAPAEPAAAGIDAA